ncbi:MAG: penicillin-binding protein 2 [Candidatus Kerfeldbacteria bacterium]|nr:penicillin-binding protein 2 [Candidatus Kerfeldbacteria bacterium]
MPRDPFSIYTKKSGGRIQKRRIAEIDATAVGTIAIGSPSDYFSSRALVVALLCVGALLFGRLAQLQVIDSEQYTSASEGNRIESERIVPLRGIITDRNGVPLVKNVSNFQLILDGSRLSKKKDTAETVFIGIKDVINATPEEYEQWFQKALEQGQEVILREGVSYDDALKLMSTVRDSRFLKVQIAYSRQYLYDSLFAQVLGYEGKINATEYATLKSAGYVMTDEVGKSGVEKQYESQLRGVPGEKRYEVDNRGRSHGLLSTTEAHSGQQLELGLDIGLQQKLFDLLKESVDNMNLTGGSAIALDPRTGAVRALVSYPSYNNNDFVGGISQEQYDRYSNDSHLPLFHRAISGQFPSGSVFKPIVATAAIDSGIATPNTTVNSVGGIEAGGAFFPDWRAGGHGITNVYLAIAQSVNTYFYLVGGGSADGTFKGLGPYKIEEYAKKFGLGSETQIDLPGEADGFVPTPEWKEEFKNEPWYLGDTYHFAIGQGDLLVTPLQVANYTAAIANGGTLYAPRVAQAFTTIDTNERTEVQPVVLNQQVASSEAISVVQNAMRQTVLVGSAQSLKQVPVAVAGKTGTAQFDNNKKEHAWFTSFAPFENPEIALTVMLEGGGEGSAAAVPIAREGLKYYFTQ